MPVQKVPGGHLGDDAALPVGLADDKEHVGVRGELYGLKDLVVQGNLVQLLEGGRLPDEDVG